MATGEKARCIVTANGYGISFWSDKNVLKLTVVVVVQLLTILKTLHFSILKCTKKCIL